VARFIAFFEARAIMRQFLLPSSKAAAFITGAHSNFVLEANTFGYSRITRQGQPLVN
jgi:hypothetical protein